MLLRHLASFIRDRPELGAQWLEHGVTWDPELLGLVNSPAFAGFEWASARGEQGVRIMGICAMLGDSASLMAQFDAAEFWILGLEHFRISPTTSTFEQLVVAEVLSASSARIHLCWLDGHGQWHVALRFIARWI